MTELSALVVLRPARGGDLGGRGPITSGTVSESLPSANAAERAVQHFRARGFGVTQPIGASFSIIAAKEKFEDEFGVKLSDEMLAHGVELPLESLPAGLASVVQAVIFTPPPDFGPTELP